MKQLVTTLYFGCALLIVLCASAKEEEQSEQAEQAQQAEQFEAVVVQGQVDLELAKELQRARADLDEAALRLLELERELEASKKEVVLRYILQAEDELEAHYPGTTASIFPKFVEEHSQAVFGESGFLGIWMTDDENGILIGKVFDDSPALDAGLQKDDVITKVDKLNLSGDVVHPTATMIDYIALHKPGTEIDLTFLRDGTETSTTATLSERPSSSLRFQALEIPEFGDAWRNRQEGNVAVARDLLRRFDGGDFRRLNDSCGPDGFWIADIEGDLGQYFDVGYGVLVLSTIKDTELKNGDILLSIDGNPVRSASHARRFIRAADDDTINISIKRKGKKARLTLDSALVKEKSSRCG